MPDLQKKTEPGRGIPGILRPFKEFIENCDLPPGSEILFYGVPGTCSPFVELLCFSIRSLPYRCIFVPYVDEGNAREMILHPGIGYRADALSTPQNPAVVVIMGGLAMPDMPTTVDSVESVLNKRVEAKKIGICFMHMFAKAGWLERISFDLLIDAEVSVEVTIS
jgi:hypothetical protein